MFATINSNMPGTDGDPPSLTIGLIAGCVSVTCICFCLEISSIICNSRTTRLHGHTSQRKHGTYSDEDGEALDEGKSPWYRRAPLTLVPAFAGLTTVVALLRCYLRNFDIPTSILAIGWLLGGLMTIHLAYEHKQHNVLISVSSLILTLALGIDIHHAFPSFILERSSKADITYGFVTWVQLALGVLLSWISSSIPQRPNVYYQGIEVDGQYTTSTIGRLAFSWIGPLLTKARTGQTLEYSDLPALTYQARSQTLKNDFPETNEFYDSRNPLWKTIVKLHWRSFVLLWTVSIIESFAMVLPPICLYHILQALEARTSTDETLHGDIWLWIWALGISKLVHVGLDSWVHWLAFGRTAIKVRSQLLAVIYAKAMRMKIIDGGIHTGTRVQPTEPSKHAAPTSDSPDIETDPLLPDNGEQATDEIAEKSSEKDVEDGDEAVARGVLNLLSLDVDRIHGFSGWNVDLVRGAAKTLIAVVFLMLLLGWESTLAGLAVPVLVQSICNFATRRYTSSQEMSSMRQDHNAHVVTEVLHGIRQIRFSATEVQWEKNILVSRNKVLASQRSLYFWHTFFTFTWFAIPVLMGAACLSVYALVHHGMTAAVAFTALSVLSSLEWTIGTFAFTITEMLDARVSAKRVEDHLNSDEQPTYSAVGNRIQFTHASIKWPSVDDGKKPFVLSNQNLDFPVGRFSVICGKTGTGKSLLLAALIGEAEILSGVVRVPVARSMYIHGGSRIEPDEWIIPNARAYVAQVPWIENASFKDSILYGLPYVKDRYDSVIHACALEADIKVLPDGEDTEIGATGINLSGGQRWRLTLARALYSRAGVLILDDIFSAVDAHVGRHVLQHAILGKLGSGRTRILATHHLGLVEQSTSYIVNLDNGTTTSREPAAEQSSSLSSSHILPSNDVNKAMLNDVVDMPVDLKIADKTPARKFVEDEARARGRVSASVYKEYMSASGSLLPWIGALLAFTISSGATMARSYWLAVWTDAYTTAESPALQHHPSVSFIEQQPDLRYYLGVYLGLSLLTITFIAIQSWVVMISSLQASRRLFETVTHRVLRAKLRWLDTEPTGRILNRFVRDFQEIDRRLGADLNWTLDGIFTLITIIAAALLVSAWMSIPMIVLMLACCYVVYLYFDGARDVKRLESVGRSPMFELVTSSLSGLATIRSFGRMDEYMDRMFLLVDKYTQATYYVVLASAWMNYRLGVLGAVLALATATLLSSLRNIDGALAGFALSFALNFQTVTENTINRYTTFELAMNSAERVVEYTKLQTEPDGGENVASSWPTEGKIEVEKLEVGYADDLPSVLKGVTFTVAPRQRVGIVGRTGSGKSSFTLSLFRMLDARNGQIKIDGIDIASLRLFDLRSRLSIIPQDPVLFSGTLRSNLDPFNDHDDTVLFDALRRVHLLDSDSLLQSSSSSSEPAGGESTNIFTNLSTPIARGGANLSQGQKQLLCLARAIIARPKILVLDEATSAVDMATDAKIQRSIREDFNETTLLVVAHRLSTVADFDRILVLDHGEVAEYDEPGVLARKEGGAFRKMVDDSGEKETLEKLFR